MGSTFKGKQHIEDLQAHRILGTFVVGGEGGSTTSAKYSPFEQAGSVAVSQRRLCRQLHPPEPAFSQPLNQPQPVCTRR
jgi:hypothetical protein